jgi:predicted enzyme related to lactoylglutathione lyase
MAPASAASSLLTIAPVLPVRDVGRAADFYTTYLGFNVRHMEADGSYAVVARDGQSVHLTDASASEEALRAARENISFVIAVDNLDGLWLAVESGKPPVKMRPPELMAWGRTRVSHVRSRRLSVAIRRPAEGGVAGA